MIMKANRNDNYELPPEFPGIDETVKFKAKLSNLYNKTRERRNSIIGKIHGKNPLLVESQFLSPSFRTTQRDLHIKMELRKITHAPPPGIYNPHHNVLQEEPRNQRFLQCDRFMYDNPNSVHYVKRPEGEAVTDLNHLEDKCRRKVTSVLPPHL